MADAEEEHPTLDELREELRGDKAVRISKKEVNELLMEFLDSFNVEGDDDENKSKVRRTTQCVKRKRTHVDRKGVSKSLSKGFRLVPRDDELTSFPLGDTFPCHWFHKFSIYFLL